MISEYGSIPQPDSCEPFQNRTQPLMQNFLLPKKQGGKVVIMLTSYTEDLVPHYLTSQNRTVQFSNGCFLDTFCVQFRMVQKPDRKSNFTLA
jgi:hypothetical protein